MNKLEVNDLGFSINDRKLIDSISLCIEEGKFVGLIGPNGSGKSTLLKCIYRIYKPNSGIVYLDGKDISKTGSKEIAKNMSVVSQENNCQFDFTVMEIILMGRYAHKNILENSARKDEQIALKALDRVGLSDFQDRSFQSLSGGEKQRVLVSRALAQDAQIIILDEPTNHLDIKHQLQILDLIKELNITVFAAIHDFNIAASYCEYIYVMDKGKIKCWGKTEDILTEELFKNVFGVKSYIYRNKYTKKLQISFYT